MKFEFLSSRLARNELSDVDVYFAEFMARICHTEDPQLVNLFANLHQATSQQHTSVSLVDRPELVEKLTPLDAVTTSTWDPGVTIDTPLVLVNTSTDSRLFLQKYFQCEARIANQFIKRNVERQATAKQLAVLEQLFPKTQTIDYQKLAAYQALTRNLVIISGGPGTGKTSTVVRILAALGEGNPDPLNIKLAAPTGKAAMRLSEAIKRNLTSLPDKLQAAVPTTVSTLHRLLGIRASGTTSKYTADNQIVADVLILDEASMIDLAMFDRLLESVPLETRIIILGDPGQLPSVETGAVLGDICDAGIVYSAAYQEKITTDLGIDAEYLASDVEPHLLADARCHLSKSYRFSDQAGIGALATILEEENHCEFVSNEQVSVINEFDLESVTAAMIAMYQPYFDAVHDQSDPESLMQAFERCQALCPTRHGEFGVQSLNDAIEDSYKPLRPNYYPGKPIMVNHNDYNLRLFNGDIGICVEHEGRLQVAFRNAEGDINFFLPTRLPQHETCFVMTVHKSQGSEFDEVLFVLPEQDRDEFISRELIYTAVTRTISHLTIFTAVNQLDFSQSRARLTGLGPRLLVQPEATASMTPDH